MRPSSQEFWRHCETFEWSPECCYEHVATLATGMISTKEVLEDIIGQTKDVAARDQKRQTKPPKAKASKAKAKAPVSKAPFSVPATVTKPKSNVREITHTIDMEAIQKRQERLDMVPNREPSARCKRGEKGPGGRAIASFQEASKAGSEEVMRGKRAMQKEVWCAGSPCASPSACHSRFVPCSCPEALLTALVNLASPNVRKAVPNQWFLLQNLYCLPNSYISIIKEHALRGTTPGVRHDTS